jgi:hypothetical protein
MSLASQALFVALVFVMPMGGFVLLVGAPISLAAGMFTIHRSIPAYSYPIALVYVPLVGALLVLLTLQVYWTIGGAYL